MMFELTAEETAIVAKAQSLLQEHIREEFKTLPKVYLGIIKGIIYMSPYLIDSMPNIVLDSRKGLMYI